MKILMKGVIAVSLTVFLAGCKEDAGEDFIGSWEGSNERGASFSYQIKKSDETYNVSRQMRDYTPDLYKGIAQDDTTMVLGDGDTLIYQPDSDSIYARGDDITLTRTGE